jgi:DNA polymerase-3 subunit delta
MTRKTSKKAGSDEFTKEISSGEISPIYIFRGDQIHLIEKALHELRTSVLGVADDMNYIVFHGDSTSAQEITENASTVPMFTKKKIVVIKNAEKLKAKDLTSLELYFESPSPLSCVVFIFSDGKAPKIMKKSLPTFDFSLEKGNTVSAVREEAQRLGCKITTRAAQTLISLVGEDLKEIHNELAKLSLYRSEGKEIDIEDIEKHTRKAQFGDVFALINAISKRNKKETHRVLLDLEEQGEEPLAVLSRIIWRFRLVWKAKELTDKKTPKPELLKELKMSPGAFYYLSEDLKKYSYNDITRIMGLLSECDKKLKMSYVPRKYQLTKLVTELFSK